MLSSLSVLSFYSENCEKWKREDHAFLLLSILIPIRCPNYHLPCKIFLNMASKAQLVMQVRNVQLAISTLINQGHSND